ncbi:GH92 family glycosyl hydrolase [Aureispira anguillae]|uniref:GH92 family glycosyl hydrolase n=1 Tax=Aureispira anguillae TaxID=2864201 RepID=A0A915YEE8_9BACT|nr:GH92 family glycosyl hydrolase [Aureispira anguillae]BDS11603.1 GH92 family glycosyl hydrolase [Aureispira anguillae]
MNKYSLLIFILFCIGCTPTNTEQNKQQESLSQYVNPFIGTGGHGHTYPGATLPFGMMQLSPDTRLTGWDGCSGYHYTDSTIYGFSHTHLSGTGVSDYGDLLLMPHSKSKAADLDYTQFLATFDKKKEKASPGYYEVVLSEDAIKVALSTTARCGMHQYTFPSNAVQKIMLDLQHRDQLLEAKLEVIDAQTIRGMRRSNAWATDQHFYFYLQFSKPFTDQSILQNEQKENVHAQFTFDNNEEALYVKVGMSSVSMEGAQKNLEKEIPHWDFKAVKEAAQEAWEEELQKVMVKSADLDKKTIFYTALYHSFLAPNLFMDVDGQYRGTDLKVHQAKNFSNYTIFSLWDTFRGTHPLYTILQRKRTLDFIQTFLAQYQQGGQLPVWELASNYTGCMIGYHSVSVIADAYAKGIRDFDTQLALEAMNHSAMQDHLGLSFYKEKGFIACDDEAESVSKTLEYAYDDWCIAEFAKAIGNDSMYQYYIQRAQSYKNLYDPNTNFLRGRIHGGWFTPFEPSEVNFNYTEANGWQYTLFAPQDIAGLIDLMGGTSSFEKMLDELFETESKLEGRHQVDITGLIGQYAHGNEPSHHVAYLYNYIHKPWKTQERVQQIMEEMYQNAPDGLSGNEDCGQMSSWYNLSAMGFYSVSPGTNYYTIGSPAFEAITINLENGKQFRIKAPKLSATNLYIQSIKLNGNNYNKTYLLHEDILAGGELVFEMGNTPNKKWGIASQSIPPSSIQDQLIVTAPYLVTTGKTFTDSTTIQMGTACTNCSLHYTTDGSIPTSESPVYENPITIKETTAFNLISIDKTGKKSTLIHEDIIKVDDSRTIQINTKYANQYAAGGDQALIDHLRGGANFRTGSWQGYRENLECVIDLSENRSFSSITVGFLQDIQAWIFYPKKVTYYGSQDGQNFSLMGEVLCDFPDNEYGAFTKDFSFKPSQNMHTRYIKIVAENYGNCPDWHLGAGGKTWVFADEILVQ